jgi:hypothetical protein
MTSTELHSQQSEIYGLMLMDLTSLASKLNLLNGCFTSLGEVGVDFDSETTCSKWLSVFDQMVDTVEAMTFPSRALYAHARAMYRLQQLSSSVTKSISSMPTMTPAQEK